MSRVPWTIDRIRDALGSAGLAQRFLYEINRTPAHELVQVFAKWERIATDTVAAVERARALATYDARGEQMPGEWIDATARIQEEAAQIRGRYAS